MLFPPKVKADRFKKALKKGISTLFVGMLVLQTVGPAYAAIIPGTVPFAGDASATPPVVAGDIQVDFIPNILVPEARRDSVKLTDSTNPSALLTFPFDPFATTPTGFDSATTATPTADITITPIAPTPGPAITNTVGANSIIDFSLFQFQPAVFPAAATENSLGARAGETESCAEATASTSSIFVCLAPGTEKANALLMEFDLSNPAFDPTNGSFEVTITGLVLVDTGAAQADLAPGLEDITFTVNYDFRENTPPTPTQFFSEAGAFSETINGITELLEQTVLDAATGQWDALQPGQLNGPIDTPTSVITVSTVLGRALTLNLAGVADAQGDVVQGYGWNLRSFTDLTGGSGPAGYIQGATAQDFGTFQNNHLDIGGSAHEDNFFGIGTASNTITFTEGEDLPGTYTFFITLSDARPAVFNSGETPRMGVMNYLQLDVFVGLPGDTNNNGEVSPADYSLAILRDGFEQGVVTVIPSVIDMLTGTPSERLSVKRGIQQADRSGDGNITSNDITSLVQLIIALLGL